MPIEKEFPPSLKSYPAMIKFIRAYAKEVGFSKAKIYEIELACEESLVNIISYGKVKDENEIVIRCESTSDVPGIKITITDHGIAFNPLKHIKTKEEIEAYNKSPHKIGGYGVYFIIKLMDKVDYQRDKKSNVLTLTKYL